MKFTKGNKLGGRKKGSKNKTTSEIREQFKLLLDANLDRIQSDLDQLEPKDRIKAFMDLARFVVPTLKSTEITTDRDQPVITIDFTE
jgi:hypothetical protein